MADRFCKESGGPPRWTYEEDLDDGHKVHAPVGSYRANGLGLHDMFGNVWEWCRDGYGLYDLPVRQGDAERLVQSAPNRVMRGGSFGYAASCARSARRVIDKPTLRDNDLGCRPARVVGAGAFPFHEGDARMPARSGGAHTGMPVQRTGDPPAWRHGSNGLMHRVAALHGIAAMFRIEEPRHARRHRHDDVLLQPADLRPVRQRRVRTLVYDDRSFPAVCDDVHGKVGGVLQAQHGLVRQNLPVVLDQHEPWLGAGDGGIDRRQRRGGDRRVLRSACVACVDSTVSIWTPQGSGADDAAQSAGRSTVVSSPGRRSTSSAASSLSS
ncbi:MAG: SUMF1/EgtB/PvdO family nonheme iron enzyme [Planctomycetes bacterium]|nr:SUMF1/EgtB/PvdO family nonheme iron enzyme [Planctomycetota bacterium]